MARGKQKPKGGEAKRERGEVAEAPTLSRIYEGPALLDRLLEKAGSKVDTAGVVERFRRAIGEGHVPPAVIPGLFETEPRFGGPEDAMRLYSNLFGVWDLLASGVETDEILRGPVAVETEEEETGPNGADHGDEGRAARTAIELPARGSVAGQELPYEVCEGIWQSLADMPPRERTRRQDRYSNLQSELAEWARTVEGLDGNAQETLEYLCFELAEMFDRAFGDRFGTVKLRALLQADSDEADKLQPYAADYVAETLEEAEEEEEEPLAPDELRLLHRYARQALVAMTAAIKG